MIARGVYRNKIFVGYYNIYIVTNKNLYVFIQKQNLYVFIPKQKRHQLCIFYSWCQKLCIFIQKTKTKTVCLYRNKSKIAINIHIIVIFLKRKLARIVSKKKRTFNHIGKKVLFFFFRKKYPNQFYSIVRMRVKIYFPQKFGRNF